MHSPKNILINTISYETVRMYKDSDGYFHMMFPQYGIDLKGAKYSASGSTYALATVGEGRCVVDCTYAGAKGVVDVVFNPPAPCNSCHFESGITISTRSDSTPPMTTFFPATKFYGTRIPSVTSTSGYVDDAFVLQVEDAIMDGLAGDPERFADSYRKYTYTGAAAGDVFDITVTYGGTAYEITAVTIAASGGWVSTDIPAIQTQLDAVATAGGPTLTAVSLVTFVTGTNGSFYIIGEANVKFTIAITASMAGITQGDRTLRIIQKYVDTKIDISYDIAHASQTVITAARLPYLRANDVFSVFVNAGFHGDLAAFASPPASVDTSTTYCKYVFTRIHKAYDDPGASRMNEYFETVNIYVKESADSVDYWVWAAGTTTGSAYGMNATAAPSGTANLDFEDAWLLLCGGLAIADPS